MRKGFAPILIIAIVAVSITAAVLYWQFKSKTAVKPQSSAQTIESTPTTATPQTKSSPQSGETASWKIYTSDCDNLNFKAPEDLNIRVQPATVCNGNTSQVNYYAMLPYCNYCSG